MPLYACQNCDSQYPKWQGRCDECGQWGSFVLEEESTVALKPSNYKKALSAPAKTKVELTTLQDLAGDALTRIKSNLEQIDPVLGGGLVPGSLVLLAGEPGIGKSTLTLQLINALQSKIETLYLSGEESAQQIKNRIDRLQIKPAITFLNQPTLEKSLAAIAQAKPGLIIVDSIQTLASEQIGSPAGNISQVRACAAGLLEICKKTNACCLLIGQITKDGLAAGPKSLEHLVDTVIYLEGDPLQDFRILRVTKNRFGPTDEICVMKMTKKGLLPVENPSAIFLESTDAAPKEGSVVTAVLDGSKTFLIEIQSLVTKSGFGYPQRRSSGFDNNRLQLLLAVLSKRAKLAQLNSCDVHINVAGGYKIKEPAADLAICLATASSLLGKTIGSSTLVFGEVGLGGEIRPVKRPELRIKEAEKLGFKKILSPGTIKTVAEAISLLK